LVLSNAALRGERTELAMTYEPYADRRREADIEPITSRNVAGKAFLWTAWALAAAFWTAVGTTGFKILGAADNPALNNGETGGFGWLFIGGVALSGLAIAFGAFSFATRDRRKDAMTERATRAEYDAIEAAGGDDADIPGPDFTPGRRESDVQTSRQGA
jgi:hypothetical protein